MQYYWASIGWYGMFIIFIPVYMFLALPLRMVVLIGETGASFAPPAPCIGGLMTAVFSLSHYLSLALPVAGNPAAGGDDLLLYLLISPSSTCRAICQRQDAGALQGDPQSQPKTIEALSGGVIATTLAVLPLYLAADAGGIRAARVAAGLRPASSAT